MIVSVLVLHRDDWEGKSPRIYYQILIHFFIVLKKNRKLTTIQETSLMQNGIVTKQLSES